MKNDTMVKLYDGLKVKGLLDKFRKYTTVKYITVLNSETPFVRYWYDLTFKQIKRLVNKTGISIDDDLLVLFITYYQLGL